MATAKQFLEVANSQFGVAEDPPGSNRNKFTSWFGTVGAWCAMFQSWCFAQVGMSYIHTAWVDDLMHHAKDGTWGLWIDPYGDIRPGDLAIFDWDGGYSDHVAAVNRVLGGGQWESIEGNWGDRVCRIVRGRENIRGFLRPKFDGAVSTPPPPPPPTTSASRISARVMGYQKQLNIFLKHQKQAAIAVDGIAGPATAHALKEFQMFANGMYAYAGDSKRITVDGVYGPETAPVLNWWTHVFLHPKPAKLPVPSGTPNLRQGSPSSDRIRQLQTALNRVMHSGLTVDGEFGPKTRAAVELFQGHAKLAVDGIYGPNTEHALRAAV